MTTAITTDILEQRSRRDARHERLFRWLLKACALLVLASLLGAAAATLWGGRDAFATFGWHFLVSSEWDPGNEVYGALVPVYGWLHDTLGAIPVIGSLFGVPISSGHNFMTAGLILAIMVLPIITSVTREVFATVPPAEKHAALALGATRWEMIKGAVFPHSFSGMVGAVMLGLGRAMGETIAVTLTIGAAVQITPNLFAGGNALPAVIVQNFGDPGTYPGREALIGCGVVLFAMTIVVNYLARTVVRRAEIRMRGVAA